MTQPFEVTPPMTSAMAAVVIYYNELSTRSTGHSIDMDQVRLQWFSESPNGWTAMATTTEPDDRHYEVFFDAIRNETTINCYKKLDSVKLPVMGFGC